MAEALPSPSLALPPRRRRRLPQPVVLTAGVVVVATVLGALLAPVLPLPDPAATSLTDARLGLGADGHLLGTDGLGRDVLARILDGARVSLIVGLASVALGFVVGGFFGVLAGYRGGLFDTLFMRTMDVILSFPSLVLALTIASFLGPSIRNVIFAIGFFTIPAFARLARAQTLAVRERDFVLATRLMGGTDWHIVLRHLVPNAVRPLVAYALLAVGTAMVAEASLSFLGLGVQAPQSSWGIMIAEGRADMVRASHLVLVPGAALFITVLALNLLGESLSNRRSRGGSVL